MRTSSRLSLIHIYPNKTSPFEFYQYWRNVADADVLKCIRMLTFLPLEQIDEMAGWEGAKLNEAKDILAYELTKLVHGDEEADKARQASKALFSGAGDAAHMPTTELTNDDLGGGQINILNLMVRCGLCASKGEARRLVQQGGVSVNDRKDVYKRQSQGREGGKVPVDYTPVKFVKKPAGGKPGMVVYTTYQTIYAVPDEALARRLSVR